MSVDETCLFMERLKILVNGTAIKKSDGWFYCPQEYENGDPQTGEIHDGEKTKKQRESEEKEAGETIESLE